jgi:NAD(P)-dependent dehydrogenase (short-subunit alcohol dehydrogenase family)
MGLLDGKAVVITGAGRGLGRAYALHAASHGAAVVVNDVDGDEAEKVTAAIRESGRTAVANGGSVADPDAARELVHQCVSEFGSLDGLVNNAGISHHAMPWAEDTDRIRAVIETNVLGGMCCGTAAARAMPGQGGGVIVNVASGAMLGQTGAAAYSASKGAIAAMTFSWATDLAEHGIRRLIRFVGDKLLQVRQMAVKEPVLQRDHWEVEDIARAFDEELRAAVDPPGRDRWWV